VPFAEASNPAEVMRSAGIGEGATI